MLPPQCLRKPVASCTDAWAERKLGGIIARGGSGGTPVSFNRSYYGGSIPFLGISDISNSSGLIQHTEKSITEAGLANSTAWVVPRGAVSLAMYASVGKVAVLGVDCATSQAFYNMVFESDSARDFVYHRLQTALEFDEWARLVSTGTQANLNAKKVLNFTIYVPTEHAEQSRIGEFFRLLDALVAASQRKVDLLKTLKRAYLQKLFPPHSETIPPLRFTDFTDPWEQQKFDSVFSPLPNNTLSRAALSYDVGVVKCVHYGDILIKYGAVTDYQTDEIPFITDAKISDYEHRLLRDGDILIADAAEDDAVGKCTEIARTGGEYVVAGLHVIACRPKIEIQQGYLGRYMNAPAYHRQLLPLMQGTKVLSVSRSALSKTTITCPASVDEQSRIGTFFATLDHLITLHQRKREQLDELKHAYLQKMFT